MTPHHRSQLPSQQAEQLASPFTQLGDLLCCLGLKRIAQAWVAQEYWICKRPQEGEQSPLLSHRQGEALDKSALILVRSPGERSIFPCGNSTPIRVELNELLQSSDGAVMQIGRSDFNISECRSLKTSEVLSILGVLKEALIGREVELCRRMKHPVIVEDRVGTPSVLLSIIIDVVKVSMAP